MTRGNKRTASPTHMDVPPRKRPVSAMGDPYVKDPPVEDEVPESFKKIAYLEELLSHPTVRSFYRVTVNAPGTQPMDLLITPDAMPCVMKELFVDVAEIDQWEGPNLPSWSAERVGWCCSTTQATEDRLATSAYKLLIARLVHSLRINLVGEMFKYPDHDPDETVDVVFSRSADGLGYTTPWPVAGYIQIGRQLYVDIDEDVDIPLLDAYYAGRAALADDIKELIGDGDGDSGDAPVAVAAAQSPDPPAAADDAPVDITTTSCFECGQRFNVWTSIVLAYDTGHGRDGVADLKGCARCVHCDKLTDLDTGARMTFMTTQEFLGRRELVAK
jgi:hypothetical protein